MAKWKSTYSLIIFLNLNLLVVPTYSANVKSLPSSKVKSDIVIEGMPGKSLSDLKSDEYAIYIDNRYIKFRVRETQSLLLTSDCFKGTKISCEAYEFAQIRPKKMIMPSPGHNNLGGIICKELFGRNLLALDSQSRETDFCRFKDGSMVSSWSLYFKHFPKGKL